MGWGEQPLNAGIVCGHPHLTWGARQGVLAVPPPATLLLLQATPGPQHPHELGSALAAQSCCAESSLAACLSPMVLLLPQGAVCWVSTFSERGGGFIQRACGPGCMEMH